MAPTQFVQGANISVASSRAQESTMSVSNIQTLVADIERIHGVDAARAWKKVPGKERIYIDTVKRNGGQRWNNGVGYATCFLDLDTGRVVARGEAGAATRKWHNANETFDQIREAWQRWMTPPTAHQRLERAAAERDGA
jgi:hypothetical protein